MRTWTMAVFAGLLVVPLAGFGMVLTAAPAGAAVDNFVDASIAGPHGLAAGSDGALWFANLNNNSIGRISTAGTVTNFTDVSISAPTSIAAGPDGALWFTNFGSDSIGRITTAGSVTSFTDVSINNPNFITGGPDNAVWFSNQGNNSIGRVDTNGVVTNYPDVTISTPGDMTTGPDGNVWFTNQSNDSIGRITTAGVISNFTDPVISHPNAIAAGSDGAMWFTNGFGNSIVRMTTAGIVTGNFTDPSLDSPDKIAAGPDGNLWFTNTYNDTVSRITTAGVITSFTDASISSPWGIAAGSDGAMWFTNPANDSIGRVSLVSVPSNTVPVATSVTAPNDAVWTVAIHNPSASTLTGVTATLHANVNGSTPRGFHQALMPVCVAGAGNSEVCTINIAAHTTAQLNVYVPTTGLTAGAAVTGDVDVATAGQPDALGTLAAVTVVSCGVACELVAATPGVVVASPAPTTAQPTQESIDLPADPPGAAPHAGVAVTLQHFNPSPTLPLGDRQLCPVTGTSQCSGQIAVVQGDFSKYVDKARPIQVKVVAKWAVAVPPGKILMLKPVGPPVQLPACVRNGVTLQYNTPCLRSEIVTGSAATNNLLSTSLIFFVGVDPHFSRRLVTTPDAPTAATATVGATSATLHWKAPTVTNGPITGYTATPYIGTAAQKAVSFPGTASSGAITGLMPGKAYTFKVVAKNIHGTGYPSVASPATIVGTPAAPIGVTATITAGVGGGSVTIHWSTPTAAATNGAPIIGCLITPYKAGVAQPAKSFVSAVTTERISGLTPGTSYTFRVAVRNSRGLGAYTTTQAITPTAE